MNTGFVDIHSHILPGVDDGASNMTESMEMIDIAYREGIRQLFLTPHYMRGSNQYRADELDRIFRELQEKVSREFSNLDLYLGNELYYSEGVTEDIRRNEVHTLGNSRYILVEFAVTVSWKEMYYALRDLVQMRVRPILAHAERYQCLMKDLEHIQELRKLDVYMQLNADSVLGSVFDVNVRWQRTLIREELITFIGTDAHDTVRRTPRMKEPVLWINRKSSSVYAKQILALNGQKVIRNVYI